MISAVPRRLTIPLPAAAAGAAYLLGGPVAAVIAAVYTHLSTRALTDHLNRRTQAEVRTRSLDDLCSLAADLRAGLPPAKPQHPAAAPTAVALRPAVAPSLQMPFPAASNDVRRQPRPGAPSRFRARTGSGALSRSGVARSGTGSGSGSEITALTDARVTALTSAVWRLAERTGAPAADLVERIEADRRAMARAGTAAEAQSAGTRMTAVLLAALPAVGLALGHSIGVNALNVLLTTTAGAVCALSAVALQCAGLAWSSRLITGATR